ncbi:MAG: DUF1634 domain-containing protein [Phycisphaeraceae bacterium]|nr:MAG: DUF1634 domain-containing protein [Phycisphaeraceae bacterium]
MSRVAWDTPRTITESRLASSAASTLRAGVAVAAALCAAGIVWSIISRGPRPDLSAFEGQPEHLTAPAGAFSAMWGDPSALAQAGLIVLIATPMVRVLVWLGVFARGREAFYTGACAVVAGLLTLAVLRGM